MVLSLLLVVLFCLDKREKRPLMKDPFLASSSLFKNFGSLLQRSTELQHLVMEVFVESLHKMFLNREIPGLKQFKFCLSSPFKSKVTLA